MKYEKLRFGKGFEVQITNRRAQLAKMVIPPGGREGGPVNRHRAADQWLIVVEGQGVAMVNGKRIAIETGSALLIGHGDTHELRNNGRRLLKTINLYSPPAYRRDGTELPPAKP